MTENARMRLVLISGLSGSGKSIALRVLEDSGFYCIDNLPLALLAQTVHLMRDEGTSKLALSIDARNGSSLQDLPGFLKQLKAEGTDLRLIFLDARDNILVRRFAETRRRHPLARGDRTIEECLIEERQLLALVAEYDHRVDTSELTPIRLRERIKDLLALESDLRALVIESFGYKAGVPRDADQVFDARCLPNPFYQPELRALTGLDAPVRHFLDQDPRALALIDEITAFLVRWLPEYARDNRNTFTVAIGCTGGQHRSVYLSERIAAKMRTEKLREESMQANHLSVRLNVIVRHRELPQT